MSDNNTYYTCKCIYFDNGYITCEICSTWIDKAKSAELVVEPIIFAKRWARIHEFNQKSKKYFLLIIYIQLTTIKKY